MKENNPISLIASIISIILVIPALVGLVFGLINNSFETIITTIVLIAALLAIFIAMLIYAFTKKHNSLIYRYLKYITAHKEHTLVLQRNTYYECIDREHFLHKKKIEVYGRNDFDSFTDRYVYSGSAKCKLKAPKYTQKIIDQSKYLGWDFYTIKSETKNKKRSTCIFEMEMEILNDPEHLSDLYLSTGIYEQTKNLIMTVKFGNSITPKNGKIRIYSDYTSRTPFYEDNIAFDTKNRSLIYELKYPIHHYKYEITWEF